MYKEYFNCLRIKPYYVFQHSFSKQDTQFKGETRELQKNLWCYYKANLFEHYS